MTSAARPARAYLAVPAHRPRMVAGAAASAADAVFLDLEDAVPPSEKRAALDGAVHALGTLDWGSKLVSVRVNAADSSSVEGELRELAVCPRLDAVILPKAEQVDAVAKAAQSLLAAAPGRARPIEIELLIETARGLINVEALAAAHPNVRALHFGVGDFAASIGARSATIGASPAGYRHVAGPETGYESIAMDVFAYPMMRLLVAARAFGLRAIDGPCGDFRDSKLTEAGAAKAAAMGFDGKQVIHPDQIGVTKRAFLPSEQEIATARRIIEALEQAEAHGHGAVTLDGKMIDYANVRMAQRVILLAS